MSIKEQLKALVLVIAGDIKKVRETVTKAVADVQAAVTKVDEVEKDLATAVVGTAALIEGVGSVETLATENKTVVGAINEVAAKAGTVDIEAKVKEVIGTEEVDFVAIYKEAVGEEATTAQPKEETTPETPAAVETPQN